MSVKLYVEGGGEGQLLDTLFRQGWRQFFEAANLQERPSGAGEDQAFLMVQVMETWFLADRDLLKSYFGPSFREHHLRQWPDLEQVSKATVLETLHKATAGCEKPYFKGRISFELLGKLKPDTVSTACPHAKALLARLRTQ